MKITKTSFIRPTLRGLVLALAVTALSSFVARAVPYASQVTKTGDTVTFVLNQAAAGITVLTNGVPLTPPPDVTTAGLKTFDMTGATTYSIIVTGNAAKAWTQFIPDGTDRNFWFPNSVSINRNPSSPNFGKVYICNNNKLVPGATGAGRTVLDGIYVLRADGVADGGLHDGGRGNAWMTADGTAYSRFMKININQDDNLLYAASYWDDQVWGFNDDLSVATQLTDASNLGNPVGNANSTQYIESVCAMGSRANGNLRLFTANANYNDSQRRGVISYSLGANATATPGDIGVQVVGPGGLSAFHIDDLDVDSNTNVYTTVYRATAGQAPDAKKFICSDPSAWPNTVPAWDAPRTDSYIRCVAVNEAGGTVAAGRFTSSSGQVYFFDINTGAAAGMVDIGNVCRDICFDKAGNMVSVDNSTEYARFWSPGGYTIATTTSDGTFQLIQWDNVSVAATDAAASETGPDTATFTISRAGGQNLAMQVNYTMGGTAVSNVDYTISPQSPFTFPAGQSSIAITVTPINDGEREPTETVVLTLASGAYNVVSPSSATATIADNDAVLSYWDSNGTTEGAGATPTGTWGTDNFWNAAADGIGTGTTAWTDWNLAVFSAGSDSLSSAYTVTVNGPQKADSLSFEDFEVTLAGGTLTLTNFTGIQVYDRALITSVLDGQAGLILDGTGSLVLGGANTYTGPTKINAGNLVVGAAGGVIPDGSAVTIGAQASLRLMDELFSYGSYDETIGSLAGSALSGSGTYNLNVPAGNTLTFGGDGTSTLFNGTEMGGGTLVKVGAGVTRMTAGAIADALTVAGGTFRINDAARLANTVTLDTGGTLENNSAGIAVNFVNQPITVNAGGGTLKAGNAEAILFITGTIVISGTGTLTYDGPGETRTYSVEHTFPKLIVKGGLYTAGQAVSPGYATSFGAIPTTLTADAITLQTGGQIRKAGGQNVFLDPFQGITLGTGGGTIRGYGGNIGSGTFGIPGPISGSGPLTVGATPDALYGSIIVLGGKNTYSGGTTLATGSLFVTNDFTGSGTGSGSVTVNTGTLGGDGAMGGPVVMNAGNLSPGYSFNLGPLPVTPVTKAIGKLVLTNGLDLSPGTATVTWQLGAPSVVNPGVDFDQVDVTGGNVALGSGATLAVGFTGTATAPDLSAFWQTSRSWQVIKFSGGGAISGNFSAITGVAGAVGGTFSTTQDANGVNLVWTSTYVTPTPGTTMDSFSVSGGNVTINYTPTAGNRWVLLSSPNVDAALSTWSRVATNLVGATSFTVTGGADAKAFYCIKSE